MNRSQLVVVSGIHIPALVLLYRGLSWIVVHKWSVVFRPGCRVPARDTRVHGSYSRRPLTNFLHHMIIWHSWRTVPSVERGTLKEARSTIFLHHIEFDRLALLAHRNAACAEALKEARSTIFLHHIQYELDRLAHRSHPLDIIGV